MKTKESNFTDGTEHRAEMVVDSMACVPKDQILKMLLEKMERGCFAHWSEKP